LGCGFLFGNTFHRNPQPLTNRLSNIPERNTLILHRVVALTGLPALQGIAEESCRIMAMDGRPTVFTFINIGGSLDIENYCTLRLFFDLSTLADLSRRNLPEAGILLLFQM
jgi:hypothetical protein